MEKTKRCKSFTYSNQNPDSFYLINYHIPVNVFQRHSRNSKRGVSYIAYRYKENGEMWIAYRSRYVSRGSTIQINNFNSHQRRFFKKLKTQAEDFKKLTYLCDNCIFLNEHILKGDCEHVDPKI